MNVLINMALLQENSKDYTSAIETLTTAQKLDPENKKIEAKIQSLRKQAGMNSSEVIVEEIPASDQ